MGVERIQSTFSLGEFDPRLLARTDWDGYYKGALSLRNMMVIPQGGATKRFGTVWVDEIEGITDDAEIRLCTFEVGADDNYALVFVPDNILIFHDGALVHTLATPYGADDIPKLRWAQDSNRLLIVHPDYAPALLKRLIAHTSWSLTDMAFKNKPVFDFLENYDTVNFTLAPAPDATSYNEDITITADANTFTAEHVGGVFIVNGLVGRIKTFTDATHIVARVTTPPAEAIATASGADCYIATPIFSTTRGWPKSATFFQNRLVFGGSRDLPEVNCLSRIGNFTDFNEWDGSKSAAITAFSRGNKAHDIQYVVAAQALLVFTINGEFSTPLLTDAAITVDNIALNQQTKNGIADIEPELIDNQVIFLDKGSKIVRSMQYDIQTGKFKAKNISVLSSHLINAPVDSTPYANPAANDGEYLFLVNGNGKIASYQTLQEENFRAWTPFDTQGEFLRAASVDNECYFIVKRSIDGVEKYYLEMLSFEHYNDCCITRDLVSPATVITQLEALEGKTVQVLADGFYVGDHVVTDGQITLEKEASLVIVGLKISISVIPMPVSLETQQGPNTYRPKRISTCYIDYFESLGIVVDGAPIPFQTYSEVGVPPTPVSGFHKHTPMKGSDPRAEIEITHETPYPFTLRGIGMSIDS